eukprot:TRINITY_DN1456_c0_g2_i1.p1 TRINITY_DN1456_c0_g2~~TRINITY_DN1456_c0_g2_i1.p1  ORF type:complete len:245 (-),score=20.98 TRINITY_DN1456_c0_g2_i1:184-918(-)
MVGDLIMPSSFENEEDFYGAQTYSYFKTISNIEVDRERGFMKFLFNSPPMKTTGTPWRYVCERFKSLNDVQYHTLAESISEFCLSIEELLCFVKKGVLPKEEVPKIFGAKSETRKIEDLISNELPTYIHCQVIREEEGEFQSTMEAIYINMKLIELLEYKIDEMLERTMVRGMHPIFHKSEQLHQMICALNFVLSMVKQDRRNTSYKTAIVSRFARKIPVTCSHALEIIDNKNYSLATLVPDSE